MDDLLKNLVDLNEAADMLGLQPVTLRAAIGRGAFAARKFGNAWVTTRDEVERYRAMNQGRSGRPETPPLKLAEIPWPQSVYGGAPLVVVGFTDTPKKDADAVVEVAKMAIATGAWTVAEIQGRIIADPETRDLRLSYGMTSPFIGMLRIIPREPGEAAPLATPPDR
jgi:hypothetical protein